MAVFVCDMACYHPLSAWRHPLYLSNGGERRLSFVPFPGWNEIKVPCGQCIGCRLERSRQWALRCVHESTLHKHNCFLTLTYDDLHLPEGGSLNIEDITKFMKRLRKRVEPLKIRFLQCGEYGSEFLRPHHHALIFGYDFPDKELFFRSSSGELTYRSAELETLWPFGFSSIGDLTFESAAYVCRYVLKKITGKNADEHYNGLKPEFITMSRRPGIASDFFDKFSDDMYPKDFITIRDGQRCRPAKFYDRLYERNHGYVALNEVKQRRISYVLDHPISESDLLRKETHQIAVAKRLKRNLEC